MKFAIITMDQRRLRDTLDEIEKQTCKKMKTSSVGCGEQIQFIKKRRKKKERNTEQRLCRDIDVRTDFTDELVQSSNDVRSEAKSRSP